MWLEDDLDAHGLPRNIAAGIVSAPYALVQRIMFGDEAFCILLVAWNHLEVEPFVKHESRYIYIYIVKSEEVTTKRLTINNLNIIDKQLSFTLIL